MRNINFIFALFMAVLFFSCTKPANWNHYLGPNQNNTYSGIEILNAWTKEGSKKIWEKKTGPGYGGSSIFGNEVFILDREKGTEDILRCFDLQTGDEKWKYTYESKGELPYPGSRSVPTVDKNYVWCVGPRGQLHCIDKNTHQSVWSHNLLEEYGGELQKWGFSISPIVHGDLVIVAPQGEKAGVVAFNKRNGKVVWESRPLTGHRFHVSPVLGKYGGIDQVIMISSCEKGEGFTTDEVVAFEVKTGRVLWRYEGLNSFACIAPLSIIEHKSGRQWPLAMENCWFAISRK